mmetsp:Transcript_28112/g.63490  ORF Transcript_28112/g.63490 Transcript_28112/m.63490 type:complete len:305 (-) Transcript_28112:261-1175(-)
MLCALKGAPFAMLSSERAEDPPLGVSESLRELWAQAADGTAFVSATSTLSGCGTTRGAATTPALPRPAPSRSTVRPREARSGAAGDDGAAGVADAARCMQAALASDSALRLAASSCRRKASASALPRFAAAAASAVAASSCSRNTLAVFIRLCSAARASSRSARILLTSLGETASGIALFGVDVRADVTEQPPLACTVLASPSFASSFSSSSFGGRSGREGFISAQMPPISAAFSSCTDSCSSSALLSGSTSLETSRRPPPSGVALASAAMPVAPASCAAAGRGIAGPESKRSRARQGPGSAAA